MLFRKKLFNSVNWEHIIPLLASTFLLISCILVSSKKFFWNDELLSFFLINDSSFSHMFAAWGDKFNQAPPLYFIVCWLWAKVFGSTDLSLRLFSSFTICITFIFVWITLRRTYHFWAVSLGTLSVFCLSKLVLYHNAEVRMYGLFAAMCALGFLLFDTISRTKKCSWKVLVANGLAHAAIVLTHLYGLFYSAAILVSFIAVDRLSKKFRLPVYFSVVSGWIFLLPLLFTILEQSDNAAKWFSAPTKRQFFAYLIFSPDFIKLIIAFLIVSVLLRIVDAFRKTPLSTNKDCNSQLSSEGSLFILAATFFGVPFLALILTLTIKPILNDRYLIPTITVSWTILMTYLASLLFPKAAISKENIGKPLSIRMLINPRNLILSTLAFLLLVYPIYYAQKWSQYTQRPGAIDATFGYTKLPIAMEAGHDFLPRLRYAENPKRYFHIRDWNTAVKNTASRYATGDYTHLEALNRQYPFIQSIQSQEFLSKYDRFLVLNEDDQKWFESRVQNNPDYTVTSLGVVDQGTLGPLKMFLAEKN